MILKVLSYVFLVCQWNFILFSDAFEVNTNDGHYTNEWAARIHGGPDVARLVAEEHGYEYFTELVGIPDTYLFRKRNIQKRSIVDWPSHTETLRNDARVVFAHQQQIQHREKRNPANLVNISGENTIENENASYSFKDPLWKRQWYMFDDHTDSDTMGHNITLNVKGVWQKGITGNGIVVCIVDDGLQWNHTDIYDNYDPFASYDTTDYDPNPFPQPNNGDPNGHGTQCAGTIAMVANNDVCGVGIAFNAKIAGIRMLDAAITDAVEANSLGFHCNYTDIYSASWGPPDNGQSIGGPQSLTKEVLENCATKGRSNNRGSIYVWASGNGGHVGDNCNYDGFANSIFTIAIGGVQANGKIPPYVERCSATVASMFSGATKNSDSLITTYLGNTCSTHFMGTSASAPVAAAVIALMLEANGNLTWRDVQHILVETSESEHLRHNPGWHTNAIGLNFSIYFGFGMINAEKAVDLATNWEMVAPKHERKIKPKNILPGKPVPFSKNVDVVFDATNETQINHLEHVQVTLDIKYSRVGALNVDLKSPQGTVTTLLFPRVKDHTMNQLKNWTVMSVQLWGESPKGLWTLTFSDETDEKNSGIINNVILTIHGTTKTTKKHSHHE